MKQKREWFYAGKAVARPVLNLDEIYMLLDYIKQANGNDILYKKLLRAKIIAEFNGLRHEKTN